jgi:hypothetical protein
VKLLLGVISAAQLGFGLLGVRKALRDGTAYDLGFMRGSPEAMKRDLWFMGTSLSPPAWMLLAQALATVLLMTRHRSRAAAKALGILGVMMSLGYPAEKSVRQAWRHPNRSITSLTLMAELLAVSMAGLGLRRRLR